MAKLLKVSDNYSATIVGNFSSSATTLAVDVAPVKTAGYLTVFDFEGNQYEKIKYTGVSGLNLTGCIRGLSFDTNSDTPVTGNAQALKNGMAIKMAMSQLYLNDLIDIVNGDKELPAVIKNPATRLITDARHLVDKEYADLISSSGIMSLLVSDNGGLTVQINTGVYLSNGVLVVYAGSASEALTDSATNYIQIKDGILEKNTTGFTANAIPLAQVVCAGGDITSLLDKRPFYTEMKVKASGGLDLDSNGLYIKLPSSAGLSLDANGLTSFGVRKSFTAGEIINGAITPVPVFIHDGSFYPENKISYTGSGAGEDYPVYGVNQFVQTFTTDADTNRIDFIELELEKFNSPTGNLIASIYAVDGSNKPTGSVLGTKSIDISTTGTTAFVKFTFASPVTVSPSTKYAIVLSYPTGSSPNFVSWKSSQTGTYANGEAGISADSGATWTMNNNDSHFKVNGYWLGEVGKIYACDTNNNNRYGFDGFAVTSAIKDAAIIIQLSGIVSGFTSLTANSEYFASDTIGTISLTPGTSEICVGKSLSTTELEIIKRSGQFILSVEAAKNTVITVPSKTRKIIINIPDIGAGSANDFYFQVTLTKVGLKIVNPGMITSGPNTYNQTFTWDTSAMTLTLSNDELVGNATIYFYN